MIRRVMSFSLLLVLLSILFVMGCDTVTEPESVPDSTPSVDYKLIWSDDFDQTNEIPDPAKWNYDLGYGYGNQNDGWGNDEWQSYTDSSDNVKVENGNLVITARYESDNYIAPGKRDGSITSGRLNTKNKFSMKYGKLQARIKPPQGDGIWPAFWMLGSNFDEISWPYCGEIDIMEMSPLYHDEKTSICTIHWWDEEDGSHQSAQGLRVYNEALANEYHIFEIEWDTQRIIGRIDNMTYFTKVIDSDTMDEFLNDFYVLINIAVGGGYGGAPTDNTSWPQSMYVDWIRAYQGEVNEEPVETFGIFTDTTPVDDGILVGADSEIYVWENTLTQGTILPYEGSNVISFVTAGMNWFGAGIQSNQPIDLSNFSGGNLNFAIKIPSDVTFHIGMNDSGNIEHFVEFPAGETKYGLNRDGDWGMVSIPMSDLAGSVNLELVSYVFMIKEENGTQCQFAIDDIYLNGGGQTQSSITFDKNSYNENENGAALTVTDTGLLSSSVDVSVNCGNESITVAVNFDSNGTGTSAIYFGATDDGSDTIAIQAGNTLTASFTDSSGNSKTTNASITSGGPALGTFGVFTDETPITDGFTIGEDAEIFVWENTLSEGSIDPYEGQNVMAWQTTGVGWFGAGVMANNPIDFSNFTGGNIKFRIKIPASVTFKIGIQDNSSHESYVQFPANQKTYGLVRDGEWGQAVIPVDDITGSVSLRNISYAFTILEESGAQCEMGIDDIYWEESSGYSNVSFDSDTYLENATNATVSVTDENLGNSTVSASVSNGSETISIDVQLNSEGAGSTVINFGLTDDANDTIAISAGDILTVTYSDYNGTIKEDTANIQSSGASDSTLGIYSETHTNPVLNYQSIINSADWSGNSGEPDTESTAVTSVEGTYVLSVNFTDLGHDWGGIAFDFGSAGQDISEYETLVFYLNKTSMPDVVRLGIKFEDTTGGETEVNISSYTPEEVGDWLKYEIPMNAFSSVNLNNMKYLGLWNPSNSSNAMLFGNLYFDNIYLTK